MTDFNKNTIVFDRANNPLPPDKATQVKLFLASDNKLKTISFDGSIKPLEGSLSDLKIFKGDFNLFYSESLKQFYRIENGKLLEVSGEGVVGDPTQVAEIVELVLPQGPEGPKGKDGVDGKDGVNGKDGRDGVDGKNGSDGKDGKDGKNGRDGRDGIDGIGVQGIPGIPGKDGVDGLPGKDGKDGLPGKDGSGGLSKSAIVKLINEYSPSGEVTKTFGYDVDDNLILLSSSKGTQSYLYDIDGNLINIVGTGSYPSKSFTYTDGNLTQVTIL